MKIIPMPEGTGALIARMAADDRKAASAEATPEPLAQSARCSVALGSAGLVFRLRALADDDRYAWNDWSEDILRQAADEIEKAEAGYQCYVRNSTKERDRLIDALFAAYEHLPAGSVRDEADAILKAYEKPALPNVSDQPRGGQP